MSAQYLERATDPVVSIPFLLTLALVGELDLDISVLFEEFCLELLFTLGPSRQMMVLGTKSEDFPVVWEVFSSGAARIPETEEGGVPGARPRDAVIPCIGA